MSMINANIFLSSIVKKVKSKYIFFILFIPILIFLTGFLMVGQSISSFKSISLSFICGYYICSILLLLIKSQLKRQNVHLKSVNNNLIIENFELKESLEKTIADRSYDLNKLNGCINRIKDVKSVCEKATVNIINILGSIIQKSKEGSEEADAVVEYFMGKTKGNRNKFFGQSYVSKMMQQNELAVSTASDVFQRVSENNKNLRHELQSVVTTVDGIHNYVSEIESIAFQTRILAINSAIEAARAGKYGRGFSVVSQEVKNLAEHSSEAAYHISERAEEAHNIMEILNKTMDKWVEDGEREMKSAEDNLRENFDLFKKSIANITEAIEVLTVNYQNISKDIEDATVTLQFQDITGQQLGAIIANFESDNTSVNQIGAGLGQRSFASASSFSDNMEQIKTFMDSNTDSESPTEPTIFDETPSSNGKDSDDEVTFF